MGYAYGYGANVSFSPVDIADKAASVRYYTIYFLNRLQSMMRYEGLPDTIPKRDLALLLLTNGWACIPDPKLTNGKPYAFFGGLGGEPSPYYMPTVCTVANPALRFEKTLKIGEECIVIPNDSMYAGLLPIVRRYATLLADNDISLRMASVNSRMQTFVSAGDDRTQKSAQQYFKDIEAGKFGVAAENAFLEGIRVHPNTPGAGHITQLIELEQYFKATLFNEIGINANYNMKRESLRANETDMNESTLLPLVDDMLNTQREAFEKLRDTYGIDIRVSLASSWEDIAKDADAETEVGEDEDQANPVKSDSE